MKRLITYLFLVIGLGFVFSVNTNASDKTLKSAIKIKEKVKYTGDFNTAYWQFMQLKINDLRGDGIVYYKFEDKLKDNGKYYRVSEDYKVVSTGIFEYKKGSSKKPQLEFKIRVVGWNGMRSDCSRDKQRIRPAKNIRPVRGE